MPNMFAAYLPIDRLYALANGQTLPDRVQGAALFADISGFTPLTAALAAEMGRQRGAEAVLDYINPIYEALVARLRAYRGSVISFAGDSITCWLDGDDGRRAVACGLDMQQIMQGFASITTPGGAHIPLSIKIAVAGGPARRFLAGDPEMHNFEALAGATLERMAAAEHQAQKGDVVVSQEIAQALGAALEIGEWRYEEETQRPFAWVKGLNLPVALDPWPEDLESRVSEARLRPWIDAPVYERLKSGAAYVAELRPVTSLFLKFGGIDYDGDDAAGEKLDIFVRRVQAALARYDGYMLQLTIGDKGSNLLAVFGAPAAHDDDPARAAAAALDIRNHPEKLAFIQSMQTGISQGMAWAGAVGGRLRCIYSVMGDEVNMAARLMGKAANGQIMVNQMIVEATQRRFQYHSLGLIQVKGRVEPLPVSELVSRRAASEQALESLYATPLVGREEFLENMLLRLDEAGRGKGQALRLEGPAGVGKSHLAAVFARQSVAQGWQTLAGLCQSTAQDTPYVPWQGILLALCGVGAGEPQAQAAQVQRTLLQANPEWAARLPLLADLLGLPFAETPLTAGLEPKQRREALLALVVEIVHAWAARQPLLLLLEDVHWLDEASAALAAAVGRAVASSRVLLLVVQRPPLEDQAILPELDALPYHTRLQLGDLSSAGVAALARNRLEAPLSPLGLQLALALAHGNPFFTEELLDALREANYLVRQNDQWELSEPAMNALIDGNCLVKVDGEWQFVENPPLGNVRLDIPDTVQGAVLARLDRLPEAHKLTLKVASVIGRTFSLALLQAVHPAAPAQPDLAATIELAGQRDFVRLERPGEDPIYIFKHNTTHEVTYGTLLFAQRQALHGRVGEWYEAQYNDRPLAELSLDAPLAIYYPLLAHHWRQAEKPERERIYAGLAGEQAAKKFANESAVRYYSRTLDLTPAGDLQGRWKLLLGREDVNDVMGKRDVQVQDLELLQGLVEQMEDDRLRCRLLLRQARYANYMSDVTAALQSAEAAAALADALQEGGLQVETQAYWGRMFWKHSEYPAALEHMKKALEKALLVENHLQEAHCYSDMGMVYNDNQDYPTALDNYEKALQVYRRIDHLLGEINCLINIGVVHFNLGNYLPAEQYYQQANKLCRSIGFRYNESVCLGVLGNNAFDLGDYAASQAYHLQALEVTREIGNRFRQAMSLDTLSLVYSFQGEPAKALEHSEQAIAIQQAIEDTYGLGYSFNHLGLAWAAAGSRPEAQAAFEQALKIRQSLEQFTLMLDDWAGLARLALQAGEWQLAREKVEEILAAIESHGIDGCEFPVWVYLTCYQVWNALGESAPASAALQAGHAILQQRAGQIQDAALRRQFLENVPFNRELLAACQGAARA